MAEEKLKCGEFLEPAPKRRNHPKNIALQSVESNSASELKTSKIRNKIKIN